MIRFIQIDNSDGADIHCNKKYICETKKSLFSEWKVVLRSDNVARIFNEDELMAVLAVVHNKTK